jgi:uncharacterized membrane protein YeaQ/YmgE (transglycosylase-associated protein family)
MATMLAIEPVSLIVLLVVGLIAGWFAALIVRGAGFGVVGDVAIGVVGAFIGTWLLGLMGIHIGGTIQAAIINATIGATVLLTIIRVVKRV